MPLGHRADKIRRELYGDGFDYPLRPYSFEMNYLPFIIPASIPGIDMRQVLTDNALKDVKLEESDREFFNSTSEL